MHSQNATSKNKRHILEIDYWRTNTAKYLEDLAYSVTTVLSSPESAVFLSDIYDDEFELNTPGNIVDDMVGPVLYRANEDVGSYNSFSTSIEIYIKFDIKKFYGLTLLEFMNMSKDKIEILVNKAEEEITKITETLDTIKDELGSDHASLPNGGDE